MRTTVNLPPRVHRRAQELGHVVSHRQVTDAYLAGLATSRGGRLATFDKALADALPRVAELIP